MSAKYEKNGLYVRDFFTYLTGELINSHAKRCWLEEMIREIGAEMSLEKDDAKLRERITIIIKAKRPEEPKKIRISKATTKLFNSDQPKKIVFDGDEIILNPVIEIEGIHIIPYDYDDMCAFTELQQRIEKLRAPDLQNVNEAVTEDDPEIKIKDEDYL